MRRWLAALVCATVVLTAAAGCATLPAGLDGDVTNGWATLPDAASFRPASGVCHDDVRSTVPQEAYAPYDCAQRHVAETIHVGDLPAAAGTASDSYGGPTGAASRAAFAECQKRATAFLGGPWRTSTVDLVAMLPGHPGWRGGARWFRCDLVDRDLRTGDPASRSGSLQGGLTGTAPRRLGCYDADTTSVRVRGLRPVSCSGRHHAEFTGLWTAPDTAWSRFTAGRDRVRRGCLGVIARYAEVPNDSMLPYRTGTITIAPDKAQWDDGLRTVQCFAYIGFRAMKGSVKGKGPKGLPVN